ncbi:fatty-acid amide hydrolase 2-A isoform X1 [Anoplophora glabripennis]|uniref:fatty-acid amide hydrolase 2-A isoform X1 n=2 Tax=Anoplophora glabripennis TaxID=217634 RepID=UPI000875971E|nr:fatty-acid amide hydrolase 2-A isoform X1 [Anoplophora glabripennis]
MKNQMDTNDRRNGLCQNKTLELLGIHYIMMDFFFSILIAFMTFLRFLTHPIYVWFAQGKKKSVPPITNDILRINATELAAKIRKKQLSSVEICQAYIDRIKQVNPIINAVVEDRFQQALKEAKTVDDYLTKCALNEEDLEKIKPLLGVPVTIKESCSLQGLSYAVGMLNRCGYKAESDGEAVARLKTSGAIPLLVSNTPEMCCCLESSNFITGYTNNPYDTTCTSGGSSGGEGALLGAGASVIGIGSDIAGSIRIPALYNGIFGHKPTARIVSLKGHFPYCYDEKFKSCLVIGPMSRYAKDLKLMLKILVGDKQATQLKLNQKVDLNKINVFFMEGTDSILETRVQSEIKAAVQDAVKYLSSQCGVKVKDHKFELKYTLNCCGKHIFNIKDLPDPLKGENDNIFTEIIKTLFGQSRYTPNLLHYLLVNKIYDLFVSDRTMEFAQLKKTFIDSLGDNGVFIYPSAYTTAGKHNQFYFLTTTAAYTILANTFGCPSTSVPCGLDKNGLPVGIQIMAAPNQDRLCLAVAEELEKHFGGWVPPK